MIGKTISHYEILEKLGEGGMGVVYKAQDTKLHRTVALKFIRSEAVEDRELKARFRTEAEAAAALIHPNICVVHEVDEADGTSFIAMEYVEGESLAQKVKQRPLPLEQALDIGIQIAEGLQAAHEKGIVHRDVKPGNVLVTGRGQAKIMDFGLARLAGATNITKTGTVLGTPAYMSPEQVRGEETDRRTDVWSLGVVLYEMVTGRLPFRGDTAQSVALTVQNQEAEPLTAVRTGVPVELDRVVSKALAKDPAQRYQHVDELLVDLRKLRSVSPGAKASAVPAWWRWKWLFAALTVLAVVVVLQFRRGSPVREASIAVLPLRLFSDNPATEQYLSFGMTEKLITDLAQIASLKVIAHTSVLRFQNSDLSISEIARQLKVAYIVEGSVVRVGESIRVTAQLIDAATELHLWADDYDREYVDVLALQADLARAIAREIHVTLTPAEDERLASARPVNPKAYEAWSKGKFALQQLSADTLSQAIEQFKLAIREDPSYAPAYAALTGAYVQAVVFGFESGRRVYPYALEAAVKAVELDGSLAEAHAALAVAQAVSYDWPQAKRSFDRAFELNPGLAELHGAYAQYWLAPQGRKAEVLAERQKAVELDPLSADARIMLGEAFALSGDFARSIERLEAVIKESPLPGALLMLAAKYARVGRCEEALAATERAAAFGKLCVPCRAFELAVCGRGAEARKELQQMERAATGPSTPVMSGEEWPALRCCAWPYGSPAIVARAYTMLGETNKAFEWLERAYDERDIWLLYVKPIWAYDALRSDPRYARLLRRMNLEP